MALCSNARSWGICRVPGWLLPWSIICWWERWGHSSCAARGWDLGLPEPQHFHCMQNSCASSACVPGDGMFERQQLQTRRSSAAQPHCSEAGCDTAACKWALQSAWACPGWHPSCVRLLLVAHLVLQCYSAVFVLTCNCWEWQRVSFVEGPGVFNAIGGEKNSAASCQCFPALLQRPLESRSSSQSSVLKGKHCLPSP